MLSLTNPAVVKFSKKNGCSLEEAREELTKTSSTGTALTTFFARDPEMLLVEMRDVQ